MKVPIGSRLALALALILLAGCDSLGYYAQAVNGELKILGERRPIPAVIADPATAAAVRKKLELVLTARNFAVSSLDLPPGGSYRSYVALDRAYPVWVVYAAPEFSLTPRLWCFPFSGCVPYRGYFSEGSAKSFASGLAARGEDVYVAGAPAYSTLGWFADPVYSSMLGWNDAELVGTIFHELAHQKLYVKGDAPFNESFADAVADAGVARFFAKRDPRQLALWRRQRRAQEIMSREVAKVRERLRQIYGSASSPMRKREEKKAAFAGLAASYREVGARFGLSWSPVFLAGLDNAALAAVQTYDRWVPAFEALLHCQDGDLPAFYRAAARIAALPPAGREARLQALADGEAGDAGASDFCAWNDSAK